MRNREGGVDGVGGWWGEEEERRKGKLQLGCKFKQITNKGTWVLHCGMKECQDWGCREAHPVLKQGIPTEIRVN